MICVENLHKLYSGVLNGVELTTKQLKEYGFNSKDINVLIEKGTIQRVKRGYYSFISSDDLFYYGKFLISKKRFFEANLCFEKSFEIDQTNLKPCFQLFLRSIENENYDRAFELFDFLNESDNKFYNVDYNYYLFLLSHITDIPDKYKEYVRYIKFDDIKVSPLDKRYKDVFIQNKVRHAAIQCKFSFAKKQLNDFILKTGYCSVQNNLSKTLLNQAIRAENLSKSRIVELLKNKDYDKVVSYLLEKQTRHSLSAAEGYELQIAQKYLEIEKSGKLPQISSNKSTVLYEAIEANDFNLALRLNCEYNEKNHVSGDNAITILLNDICDLIKDIKKKKASETLLLKVKSLLMDNDLDSAFIYLRDYLKSINKTNFEYLVVDLIKISLLEEDFEFVKPNAILGSIGQDDFEFDVSEYVQAFYVALSQNKLEVARIYLDIISKSSKYSENNMLSDNLYKLLQSSEAILDSKIETPNGQINLPAAQDKTNTDVQSSNASSKKDTKPLNVSLNKDKESEKDYSQEEEFVAERYRELLEHKEIILLKPMDENKINRILDIVSEYSDMSAFVIEFMGKKQIFLKYQEEHTPVKEVQKLIELADNAYKSRKYRVYIKYQLQLLNIFEEPKAFIFVKLGIAYLKTNQIDKAVDFLTIATYLNKKIGLDYDFSDLILRIKNEIPNDEIKPNVKMKEKDFDYGDVKDYFGVDNFDLIHMFIMSSSFDVERACQMFNLTPEQTELVRLIYAREYYAQGFFDKGDSFFKVVEQSKNKNELVIRAMNEVRKNKKFYQNRQVEKPRVLELTIMPKNNQKKG